MGFWRRGAPRNAAVLAVVGLIIGILAAFHPGQTVTDLRLNDGGVWVTNFRDGLVGHLNVASRRLDGSVVPDGSTFDVSQFGQDVLLNMGDGATYDRIEPAAMALDAPAPFQVPDGLRVRHGGATAAVIEPASGRVWVHSARSLSGFSAEAKATVPAAAPARVVVSITGTTLVLGGDGLVTRVPLGGDTPTPAGEPTALPGYDAAAFRSVETTLTAVGDELVAYDPETGRVWTPEGLVTLDLTGGRLQDPGPAADDVVIAGPAGLTKVPLGGGAATSVEAATPGGTPTAPVVVAGCAYGAWEGTGAYVRDCPDAEDDRNQTIDSITDATNLRFRVNRDVVVLNDAATGGIVLVEDEFTEVDNWEQFEAQSEGDGDDDGSDPDDARDDNRATDGPNTPPEARPDEFGVRAGRATSLPILANDIDADGDVLTAAVVEGDATKDFPLGALAPVRGGEALLLTVPRDAPDDPTATFQYEASDGRGGTSAPAEVAIRVVPEDENSPPEQIGERATLEIAQGGQARYDVLPDWRDPDGDPVTVVGVEAPSVLSARSQPDGMITIRDLGRGQGTHTVNVTVTDGRATQKGSLRVRVLTDDNAEPVANADHARLLAETSATITPVANDTDPDGDALRLASVGKAPAGISVSSDLAAGTITIEAPEEETTGYLDYEVTDGPHLVPGRIRIDVADPAKDGLPVPDSDIAQVPVGGSVLADVLANDDDPTGGVLVLQSVQVPRDAGYTAQIVGHTQVRITAPAQVRPRAGFTYTVANAAGQATGTVSVVSLAVDPEAEAPVAVDDVATVRAGDVVSVPALANDYSPTARTLTLDPDLAVAEGGNLGTFFVSGERVRFKAGAEAGLAQVTYTIKDEVGNFASAQVEITIVGNGSNSPPIPPPLTARMLAGSAARIPVPLQGIDPDGDSVVIVGATSSPGKGTVAVDGDALIYTAPEGSVGTDRFTYAVTDALGATGTGTVAVGIAPPPQVNQNPVTVPDVVRARPGLTLAVPVLGNDFDPDGDTVNLMPDSATPVDPDGEAAETRGSRVVLDTAGDGDVQSYYYDADDGRGGRARGNVTVRVSADAPTYPPVAVDDVLGPEDVEGQTSVLVDVLANDDDPDGDVENLRVGSEEDGVAVEGSQLRVPVTTQRQLLLYTVTDIDDQVATAIVDVPAVIPEEPDPEDPEEQGPPPALNTAGLPLRGTAGEPVTIILADHVTVRAGRAPRITSERAVSASLGANGDPLVLDGGTLRYTSEPDFSGTTSVTAEITDAASADDETGLTSILTFPIEITAEGNTPPTFRPTEIAVAAGESAVATELAPMADDVDPEDAGSLRFILGEVTGPFDVSLSGSVLTVSAPADAVDGAAGSAMITVTDGKDPADEVGVPLVVVASTRPLMTTTDAVIDDASAGESSSIDVTDYVTNPFADTGDPIEIVGSPTIIAGEGTVTHSGTTVTVTPAAAFHGQLVVHYTVSDATRDERRWVIGRILATVRAQPEPPTAVVATTTASRTATISWTPGASNGSEITDFTVTWSGGSRSCGAVTSCSIDTLTNNTAYTFRVYATNAVGDSALSEASNSVTPDARPDTPAAPTLTPGDGQLAIAWTAPATEGTPVTEYALEISPPAPSGSQVVTNSTAYVWSGLTNGTAYRVRVQANPNATLPSEFSAYSAQAVPVGRPGAPGTPTATMNGDKSLDPTATITWPAADGNGDNGMTYEVRYAGGGATLWTGTSRTTTVALPVSDSAVAFEVQASNSVGPGAWSAASNAVRAFKAPGAPGGVEADPTGADNQVTITFTPGDLNGALTSEMTYQWAVGQHRGAVTSGQVVTHPSFINGRDVSVRVIATSTVGGTSATSEPSAAAVVSAYGPPRAPKVSARGNVNDVTLTWDATSSANGRAIKEVQLETTDGGTWTVTDVSGSVQEGSGRGDTVTIRARALDAEGAWSDWATADATTWGEAYSVTSHGATCQFVTGCRLVYVELHNWDPGRTVRCQVAGQGAKDWYADAVIDTNGYGGRLNNGPNGPLFDSPGATIPDGRNTVACNYL